MTKDEVSITLQILARSRDEVTLQAGLADPMQKLHAAWEFDDLDIFNCSLQDLEDYLANVQDPYTRGVATGAYLARCADRAGKLLQLSAPEVH